MFTMPDGRVLGRLDMQANLWLAAIALKLQSKNTGAHSLVRRGCRVRRCGGAKEIDMPGERGGSGSGKEREQRRGATRSRVQREGRSVHFGGGDQGKGREKKLGSGVDGQHVALV